MPQGCILQSMVQAVTLLSFLLICLFPVIHTSIAHSIIHSSTPNIHLPCPSLHSLIYLPVHSPSIHPPHPSTSPSSHSLIQTPLTLYICPSIRPLLPCPLHPSIHSCIYLPIHLFYPPIHALLSLICATKDAEEDIQATTVPVLCESVDGSICFL